MFPNKSLNGNKYIKKLWQEAHNIGSEKREDDPPLSEMCGAVAQLLRPDQARPVSLRTSSLLVSGAAKVYKKRLDYLLSDLQCLDKRMRTRNLNSSEDSDTDTEMEFDDDGTSTTSASKNVTIRKKCVRDQRKKQSEKRESVSTDSSIREPEQMRDMQREAPVSPILPCKRPSKSRSPVTPDLHTDDGPTPAKKPCKRRISMTPIFSSPESGDLNHDQLVNLFDDAFFEPDTIEKDCGEFETLSLPTPLELGAEEISEMNKESALSPVLRRRNADENTPEVIQRNTRNLTFNLEPTSSSEDHNANTPAEGAKSPLRFPPTSLPASEDTQTTTNHVSTQTEPPAAPGSTLPYAITLVFSTSRVIPCKIIVSSVHPDILD